jgi:inner membrane protein YidH
MIDEKRIGTDTSTELARERTRATADRTLMAWIRTSLSLIGFGFGIGKAFALLSAALPAKQWDPLRSSVVFAISFTALGVLSLIGAIIQYGLMLKHLEQGAFTYKASRALTMAVAIVLVLIGLYSLVAIVLMLR